MTRTTPPRPVDIAAVFPEIAPLARTATRLHPRPGTPGVHDSSVGGPLLWPSTEPWPVCGESHDNEGDFTRLDAERRRRHILSGAWGRLRKGERSDFRPEERAELDRLDRLDRETADPDTPTTMLTVAQLYLRDVPDLVGPPGADVLQILWCPRDHDYIYCPALVLRWRRSADVTDVLTEQPEPEVMEYEYLPNPCVLHPEQVVEYPYGDFLPGDLRKRIRAWAESSGHRYFYELSIANGWKVGGYAAWNLTDPMPMVCDCGADMELLLRIDSSEWDGTHSWRPLEDTGPDSEFHEYPNRSTPTEITIGRGYSLWVFTCPISFDHPHAVSMQ
jgi:hypothetical protein